MTLSKRSQIVAAFGLADVCWFVGIVLAVMAGEPFGTEAFWVFGGLGLWCLIHGTQMWGKVGGFPLCGEDGHPCCVSLLRNLAMTLLVYAGIGVMGTPLWIAAYYLAHHRIF